MRPYIRLDLDELLERVNDRDSFLAFVRALASGFHDETEKEKEMPSRPYGPGANGWENGSIDAYLEASVAWTEDFQHKDQDFLREPSWKSFAQFLYAGKFYE